ncbi:MAG TPA: hypothetical protein VKA02_10600 [Candidatus Acidoferrum sp.]|nr:hypothetical protein [Candidatus Acidoferrum sp.]
MFQIKQECFWRANCTGVIAVALVLGILIFGVYGAPSASAAPNKDKDEVFTRVYQHTYDEVLQASLEAIERMGMFVTARDKDKGTIAGYGTIGNNVKVSFEIQIEAINTSPETRVTINTTAKNQSRLCPNCKPEAMSQFKARFSTELQKVLSTYH